MTKYELKRLKHRRQVVNKRLKALDRAGYSDIGIVNTARATLGAEYVPAITKSMNAERINELKTVIDRLFESSYTTVSAAKEVYKSRQTNLKKLLSQVTHRSVGDVETQKISQYIPYANLKEILKEYIYEDVIETAIQMADAGVSYSEEYFNIALQDTVKGAFVELLKDQNIWTDDDLQSGVIGDYAEKMAIGEMKLEDVIQEVTMRGDNDD